MEIPVDHICEKHAVHLAASLEAALLFQKYMGPSQNHWLGDVENAACENETI